VVRRLLVSRPGVRRGCDALRRRACCSAMKRYEAQPGEPAPISGRYLLLNVLGSPVAQFEMIIAKGDRLPAAPRGHTWLLVIPGSATAGDQGGC
jgi:hypothetical protein